MGILKHLNLLVVVFLLYSITMNLTIRKQTSFTPYSIGLDIILIGVNFYIWYRFTYKRAKKEKIESEKIIKTIEEKNANSI